MLLSRYTLQEFKKQYENVILRGQDAGSSEKEREAANAKTNDLTHIVNQCLIRRTNQILTKYLPVKFEMVVCVRMTDVQKSIYKSFLQSDSLRKNLLGKKLHREFVVTNSTLLTLHILLQIKMRRVAA